MRLRVHRYKIYVAYNYMHFYMCNCNSVICLVCTVDPCINFIKLNACDFCLSLGYAMGFATWNLLI